LGERIRKWLREIGVLGEPIKKKPALHQNKKGYKNGEQTTSKRNQYTLKKSGYPSDNAYLDKRRASSPTWKVRGLARKRGP